MIYTSLEVRMMAEVVRGHGNLVWNKDPDSGRLRGFEKTYRYRKWPENRQ